MTEITESAKAGFELRNLSIKPIYYRYICHKLEKLS